MTSYRHIKVSDRDFFVDFIRKFVHYNEKGTYMYRAKYHFREWRAPKDSIDENFARGKVQTLHKEDIHEVWYLRELAKFHVVVLGILTVTNSQVLLLQVAVYRLDRNLPY